MKNYILKLVILTMIYSCGNQSNTSEVDNNFSVAERLATVDANKTVKLGEPTADKIDNLLGVLSNYYGESKDSIGIFTNSARLALLDNGISETNMHILEEMKLAGAVKGVKYRESVAMYCVFRTNQSNK